MGEKILEVRDLTTSFKTERGVMNAVQGVSFHVDKGEILGLVGESGCGKSTTGRVILRLIEPTGGKVTFDGVDVESLGKLEMRQMRQDMQLIFQDPFASLNPRKSVSCKAEFRNPASGFPVSSGFLGSSYLFSLSSSS